ncbi:MAG: translation initiation factor IF-2, partial [Myxococcales bacterium]|nr:translation initiation factor IF-2 [Myxococcales bacterium]
PKLVEKEMGKAEVRQVFTIPKAGTVAGSYVTEGKIARGAKARLVRDSVVVWEGKVASLRRFKDDAKEVASGYECGISLEGFNDIHERDVIETFEVEEVAATLE